MRWFRGLAIVVVAGLVFTGLFGCAFFNGSPIASFEVSPTTGSAPLLVQLNASSSFDPEGDSLTFAWDFGDGSSGAGTSAAHTYPTTGQYVIKLTVTDSQGKQSTMSQTIWVITPTDLPKASFTASPSSGGTPLTAAFNAAASTDSNGTIKSYAWTYGDGSTASGVSVIHSYTAAGTYTVTLKVTDDEGYTDTMSMTIVVIDGGQGGCS